MFFVNREIGYLCMWTISNWLERNRTLIQLGKFSWKTSIWENQHHFLTMFIQAALKENVRLARILWIITELCSNPGFLPGAAEKLSETKAAEKRDAEIISSWSYDTEGHAKKWVERYCELANKATQQFHKVAKPCMDDHQFKEEVTGSDGELSAVCSQIVLECLYLARIGRLDILWSVNKLARAITKWTKSCDKRLARLISYIHHTCEYSQYCYVGNTAQHCRLGLFQGSDFAGDFEDSKSTWGGILCFFGSRTFVPISWMCIRETNLSFTQFCGAEVISLSRCRFTHGLHSRSHSLGFGDWSLSFRTEQNRWTQERASGKPVGSCQHA